MNSASAGDAAALRQSYDALPYANLPAYVTHPDFLATAARLAGLMPPPLAGARVLELGCGLGENLLALAVAIPGGDFTGIDLSPAQIAAARAQAADLGLGNCRFEVADLREASAGLGEFDYIICHGVYSHVPPAVQQAILALCAGHLAGNGVAGISYNALPGWHRRRIVGEILRRGAASAGDAADPRTRVAAARALLAQLAAAVPADGSGYHLALTQESELLARLPDSYVQHEHLDPWNEALHVTDFVARATAHGLAYLGDPLPEPLPADLPVAMGSLLASVAGQVEREQLHDLLVGRTFRRALLGRADAARDEAAPMAAVATLLARGRAAPEAAATQPRVIADEVFRCPDGRAVISNDPLVKAVLTLLHGAQPRALPCAELRSAVAATLAGAWPADYPADSPEAFAGVLLRLHHGGMLRLHSHDPGAADTPGEQPVASPLARAQARSGKRVSNLYHDTVELGDAECRLLPLLDGSRGRAALETEGPGLTAGALEETLRRLARLALLQR